MNLNGISHTTGNTAGCYSDKSWIIYLGQPGNFVFIIRDIETEIPNRGAEIILYCGGGFRSALAAESIQKMGYTNVISMDGGIKAWRTKGLPEDRG